VSDEEKFNYAVSCVLPDGKGGYEPCPTLLTKKQVIRYLHLDTLPVKDPANTLEYYVSKGLLRPTPIGGVNFYTREECDRFLAEQTERAYEKRGVKHERR
jgi:hypothetical protein